MPQETLSSKTTSGWTTGCLSDRAGLTVAVALIDSEKSYPTSRGETHER